MIKALLGKKIGMTRIFDKDSKNVAVTLVQTGPCEVTDLKKKDVNGYNAIQLAYGNKKNVSKGILGHLAKSKTKQNQYIKEFPSFAKATDDKPVLKVGDKITVEVFQPGDKVQVVATSKGKGYAGVMKRHGFHGSPASHGHENPRSSGSIGCRYPQRTIKGKRMPGHMGTDRITTKGLKIVDVDLDNNIIAVSGAIPGSNKGLVQIIGE